jgi:hypothetical protein
MNGKTRKPLSYNQLRFCCHCVAYTLQTRSAMRGLDPAAAWSRCIPIPANASSLTLSATSVSRGKSRLSHGFLAVDLRPVGKRYGQHRGRMSRADYFRGKVARVDYAAEGVRLLTPSAQSTAIQDVPQWMGVNRAPVASGAEQWDVVPIGLQPGGSCSGGIRFVGQRMALA